MQACENSRFESYVDLSKKGFQILSLSVQA
jgi:hypothetical protein